MASSPVSQLGPVVQKDPVLQSIALEIAWEAGEDPYSKALKLYASNPSYPMVQNFLFSLYIQKKEICPLACLLRKMCVRDISTSNIVDLVLFSIEQNRPCLAQEMRSVLGTLDPMIDVALSLAARDPEAQEKLDALVNGGELTQLERYDLLRISSAL